MTDKVKLKRSVRSATTSLSQMNSGHSRRSRQESSEQIKQRPSNKNLPPSRRHHPAAGSNSSPTSVLNKTAQPIMNSRRCQATLKSASKGPRQRVRRQPPAATNNRATSGGALGAARRTALRLTAPGPAHICSGCKHPIRDRYLLSACDKYWHNDCLKCDRCHAKLGELGSSLYERANMNLCRQDYLEMFGQKAICAVCDKLIYASEMVMRARDNVYHLECFACQLCGLRFCIGDRFYLCENKIVCQYDYDEHVYPIQESMFDCQSAHMPNTSAPQVPPTNLAGESFLHSSLQTTNSLDFVSLLANSTSQIECPSLVVFDPNNLGLSYNANSSQTETDATLQVPSEGAQQPNIESSEAIELTVLGDGFSGSADREASQDDATQTDPVERERDEMTRADFAQAEPN